jgi:hypothetical protein
VHTTPGPLCRECAAASVSPQSSGARAGLHRKKKIYKVTSLHPPLTEHAQPFKFVRQTDMFLLDGAEGSIPASYAARASTSRHLMQVYRHGGDYTQLGWPRPACCQSLCWSSFGLVSPSVGHSGPDHLRLSTPQPSISPDIPASSTYLPRPVFQMQAHLSYMPTYSQSYQVQPQGEPPARCVGHSPPCPVHLLVSCFFPNSSRRLQEDYRRITLDRNQHRPPQLSPASPL